jgi:ubiquinone/menaquinone biosynthesis C-methylase UbiE
MSGMCDISLGRPATHGQEILRRRARLTNHLVQFKEKNVLDFGCGNGAQTITFANHTCRIVAVDISHENLQALAETIRQEALSTILPVQYNGSQLPLAADSIDLLLGYEVLEHVQDESATLRELSRVMHKGAEAVISVPNKAWIFETHGAHLPLFPWHRVPFLSWLPARIHRRIARARIYRKRDIHRRLRKHGFEILSSLYITAPMDAIRTSWLRRFLRMTVFKTDATRLPFLSTAILVHCRKTGVFHPASL